LVIEFCFSETKLRYLMERHRICRCVPVSEDQFRTHYFGFWWPKAPANQIWL